MVEAYYFVFGEQINNEFKITVNSNETLLGVEIDENLRFDIHINKICKKAAKQLNSLNRIARHMREKERTIIINSFILCHFNYCPLIWLLCLNNLSPIFMKDYFLQKTTTHNLRIQNPLLIRKVKTTTYGIKSLSFQGPRIWNSLPDEIKTAQNAKQFKNLIKTWFHENKCTRSFCSK